MLLANVAEIVRSTAPLINILAGCFFGIWILEKVVAMFHANKKADTFMN
jgi:hypothetical protein